MAAALTRPHPLLPPRPAGLGRSLLLAALAHALLIAALSVGLNWRLRSPEVVYAAELWSPQQAAPAPVAPPPAPPRVEQRTPPPPERADAQIAVEKAQRQQRIEQARKDEEQRLQKARDDKLREERLKEEQRKKDAAAQREAQAEEQRLAQQREANLARIRGLAGATGAPDASGSAQRDAAPSAAYAGRIKARIKPNIVLAVEVAGNPVAEVEVRCAGDGTIIGRRLVKRSGNEVWDDTVLRAIDRTEVLPRDVDGRVPATMLLVFPRRE
jgi:colicin import membrane protein